MPHTKCDAHAMVSRAYSRTISRCERGLIADKPAEEGRSNSPSAMRRRKQTVPVIPGDLLQDQPQGKPEKKQPRAEDKGGFWSRAKGLVTPKVPTSMTPSGFSKRSNPGTCNYSAAEL